MQNMCNAPDCDRLERSLGYCEKHYMRLRRTGRLDVASWQEKFWRQVDKTGSCWLWTGYMSSDGYGRFKHAGRAQNAHRISWKLLVGEIPAGLQLDHLCRVKACVNPAHLEPVTAGENTRRVPNHPIVLNAAKTHCPQGHPYSGANLHIDARGRRRCRTCHRLLEQRRRDQGIAKPRR